MNIKRALGLSAVSFSTLYLIGCASAYTINVTAAPEGAEISQGGKVVGQAPVTLNFNADPNYMSGGCLLAAGVTATWTSGAQATTEPILQLCQKGHVQHVHLNRPPNAPGLDDDLRIAVMQAQHRMNKELIAAEQAPEAARALGAAIRTLLSQ